RQAKRACSRPGDRAGPCRLQGSFVQRDRPPDHRKFFPLVCQSAANCGGRGVTLRFTILGCGSSGGVPRPALGWGACDPQNPKNRRRRTSLLVEQQNGAGITRVLVDTPPDLREQLLDAEVDWLDAVLYSHEHAAHTHGIDDLRSLAIHRRGRVDVYLDAATAEVVKARFGYCFTTPPGSEYPPIVTERRIEPPRAIEVNGAGGAV